MFGKTGAVRSVRGAMGFSWFDLGHVFQRSQAGFNLIGANAFEQGTQDECTSSSGVRIYLPIAELGIERRQFAPNAACRSEPEASGFRCRGRRKRYDRPFNHLKGFVRTSYAGFRH